MSQKVDLDQVRAAALARIARSERNVKLAFLAGEVRALTVGLGADGDVLAGRHGHRAGDEARDARGQHGRRVA